MRPAKPPQNLRKERDDMLIHQLLEACKNGNAITVRKVLQTHHVSPEVKDATGVSALSRACRAGHYTIAKVLIDFGADPNNCDAVGVGPLHHAAVGMYEDIVRLLLLNRANPQMRTKCGYMARDYARYKTKVWRMLDMEYGDMPKKKPSLDVIGKFTKSKSSKKKIK